MVTVRKFRLPGSSRSGEKPRKKSWPERRPLEFEDGFQDLVRRSGIGRRFQNHELTRAQTGGDGAGRLLYEAQIRLAVGRQRRRDADDDDVAVTEAVEFMRGGKGAGARETGHILRRHRVDVGASGVQLAHLYGIDVEPLDGEAPACGCGGKRKSHIAEPDHADQRLPVPEAFRELAACGVCSSRFHVARLLASAFVACCGVGDHPVLPDAMGGWPPSLAEARYHEDPRSARQERRGRAASGCLRFRSPDGAPRVPGAGPAGVPCGPRAALPKASRRLPG